MSALNLGPFDLLAPAGAGAMGVVWRAVHRAQQVPVAIKIVTADRARAERYRRMFGREVRAVARLDHGGIVRVFDHGVVPAALAEQTRGRLPLGAPWLAMSWLDGGLLRDRRGTLGWPVLRQTLLALLDALSHAHARGLVHRDFKDANVLFGPDGPVVTDFGLAIEDDELADGALRRVAGTPYFMAPETARGEVRRFGPWTDLYALGCVAFALASGAPPFAGGAPLEVMRAQSSARRPRLFARHPVPPDFAAWVRRLMAIDPRARFRFAADAAFALSRLEPLDGGGVIDLPPPSANDAAEATLWAPPTFVAVGESAWAGAAPGTERPPMPRRWRRPPGPARPLALAGVGRSLVALREPRLRGRTAERDALWAALSDVVQGDGPRAVIVSGASGTGKTRLARWLQQRAHELGVADGLVATHAPTPEPGDGPAAMLARALRCRGLDGGQRLAHIRRALDAPDDERIRRIAAALDPEPALERGGEAEQITAWWLALALLGRPRPLIVLVDDAQWADDALALVRHGLTRSDVPLLFVLTVRDDVAVDGLRGLSEHPRVTAIEVGALDGPTLRGMVDDRLHFAPDTAELVEARAAGNPLFATELVQHWVQAGVLVPGADGFRVRRTARDALPEGWGALWRARLERAVAGAEPWAAEALEGAAVLGVGPDPGEWCALCEAAGFERPARAEERLLHGRLLLEAGGGWRFAHGMLRAALLERARVGGRLRRWHHLAAEVLADSAGVDRDRRRAHHLQRAGLPERARPIFAAVAWRAWSASEDRRARGAVIAAARAAWRAGLRDRDPARAELCALWSLCARGDRRALRHARRAMRAVDRADPLTAARIRFAWAYADTGGSEPARAAARFEEAVRAARTAVAHGAVEGDAGPAVILAVRALRWRTVLLARMGDAAAAGRCLDDAEALAAEHPDAIGPVERGYFAARRAELALARGDAEGARRLATAAHDTFAEAGHRGGVGMVARQLSEIARATGAQLEAERHLREARAIWQELGRVQAVRLSDLNLGLLLGEMGRFAEARALLEGVRGPGCPAHYAVLACLLLLPGDADAGDWPAWDRHWAAIEPIRAGRVIEADVAVAARLAARTAAAAGEAGRAEAAWRLAVDQFTRLGRADAVAALHAERSASPTAPLPAADDRPPDSAR